MAGQWFSLISPTNKTDCHDIAELLLKVALNTITLTPSPNSKSENIHGYDYTVVRFTSSLYNHLCSVGMC